jgi:hypothetical protein
MNLLRVMILAIVQGLAELLPVSSAFDKNRNFSTVFSVFSAHLISRFVGVFGGYCAQLGKRPAAEKIKIDTLPVRRQCIQMAHTWRCKSDGTRYAAPNHERGEFL